MKYEHPCPACKGTKKLKQFSCECNAEVVYEDMTEEWIRCHGCEESDEGEHLDIIEDDCDVCGGSGLEKYDSRKDIHTQIKNNPKFKVGAIGAQYGFY